MRTLAALLIFAGVAIAAPLTVTVRTDDGAGNHVPVPGAAVIAADAGATVFPEDALSGALSTDPAGRAVIPEAARGSGKNLVVVGAPFRGFASVVVGPDETEVTIDLPAEAILAGRVVDAQGRAVPAAEVRLTRETGEDLAVPTGRGRLSFRTYCDVEGQFRVDRLARGARYAVVVRAPPSAPLVLRDHEPPPEPVTLALAPGAAVRGRVTARPGGEPVAGAEVVAGEATARTGPDGSFVLRGIAPGTVVLGVRAPGVRSVEEARMLLGPGEERSGVVLAVRAAARIRGRVLRPDTTPAAGAEVFLVYPSDPARPGETRRIETARCDDTGRFESQDLDPARGVDLIARHPESSPVAHLGYTLSAGASVEAVVFLRPGGVLAGRVIAAETGEGVEGATVTAVDEAAAPAGPGAPLGTAGLLSVSATTGKDGAFVLPHVPAGRRLLRAVAPGRPPASLAGVEVAEGSRREGLGLVLGTGVVLAGTVRGTGGVPLADAEVAAEGAFGIRAETRTGADGTFRLAGLVAGPWRVSVSAPGYAPGVTPEAIAPGPALDFVLGRTTGIAGRVVVPGSGPTAAIVRALLWREEDPAEPGRPSWSVVAVRRAGAGDGAFAFADLPPETFRLEAFAENGSHGLLDGVRAGGEPVEIAVVPGFPVSGRVVRSIDGRPVEAAEVALRGNADLPAPCATRTDAEGRFRLSGLPPGFHAVLVSAPGFAPRLVAGVEVREGSETEISDIRLSEGAVVRGTVTGSGGAPRVGLAVRLRTVASGAEVRVVTDERGEFEVSGLAAGEWLARVEDARAGTGGAERERLFRVPEEGEVELLLGTGQGTTVSGRITRRGDAQPHAAITALRITGGIAEDRAFLTVRATAEGDYQLPDLDPGDYVLLVRTAGPGGFAARFPIRVRPGPSQTEDLRLADSGIAGRVEDLDTGEGVAGAELVLIREGDPGTGFMAGLFAEEGRVRSGEEGEFRFESVEPGLYRIRAFREGSGQAVAGPIRVLPGGETPARIALPRGARLIVRVFSDRGRPAPAARVRVLDAAGEPATLPADRPCDAEGRCVLDGLRAGVYTVRVEAEGRAPAERTGVEVFPGGQPLEVELRLAAEGRLVLRVAGPGGFGLSGAKVSLRDFWGRPVPFTRVEAGLRRAFREPDQSDEDGELAIPGLPAGIYEVSAELPGFAGRPARVRVLDGEMSRGTVVLAPIEKR